MADTTSVVEAEATVAPAKSGIRRFAIPALRVLVALVIAYFIFASVYGQWDDVVKAFKSIAWPSAVLSLVAALAAMAANTMAWRAALADLEHDIDVPTASRIYLVGGLAKYIPGSVWAFVLQMELGRRTGLPRARAFLAGLVQMGLGITAGLLLGVFGLQPLFKAAANSAGGKFILYAVLAAVPIALICALPPVLTRLIQLFLKVLRRKPLEHVLSWGGVLLVVGWSALGFAFFGVHLWLLTNALAEPGVGGMLQCIGTMALAMIAGTIIVIAPSGIGPREFVLTAGLAPFLGDTGLAIGIAVASRVIMTVADVISAGGAAISAVRVLKNDAPS